MMSAEEMFKKNNLIKTKDNEEYIKYELISDIWRYYIVFEKKYKTINFNMYEVINMQDLEAINKQVEELGWNNEQKQK